MVGAKLLGSLRPHGPARDGRLDLHLENALAIESGRHAIQVVQRPQKERSAAEQEHRQRDLRDDERPPETIVRGRTTGTAWFRRIDARRPQRRARG